MELSDKVIEKRRESLEGGLEPFRERWVFRNKDTPCLIPSVLKPGSKNRAVPYHYFAFQKFGRAKMETVSSNKVGTDALTISHMCGSKGSRCCNKDHLEIVPKKVNDKRTHCHYFLRKAYKRHHIASYDQKRRRKTGNRINRYKVAQKHTTLYHCNHEPNCGYIPEPENGYFTIPKKNNK